MAQSLTDWLQQSRLTVVEVDRSHGRLRVKGVEDACSDLVCPDTAIVVTDEGHSALDALNPGDIVKLESVAGRLDKIVVVRRVWEEIASPEL
jgi:hypothetical protein